MDTDYNKLLYEKMQAENETFKDWLLSQEPSEILHDAVHGRYGTVAKTGEGNVSVAKSFA